jgi:NTP pyrophosphatase (non-canonical NTP hydrolase)
VTLNDYQKQALTTAQDEGVEVMHRILGLVGEAGEVAERIKKIYRDHNGDFNQLDKQSLNKELGDVLWYIATLADYLGISLEDIAQTNVKHLQRRQKHGLIQGSGSDR